MKAVCTILGWCTAAAVTDGMGIEEDAFGVGPSLGGELLPAPLTSASFPLPLTVLPLPAPSGLLEPDERSFGAVVLVGVVISIGSPGDGADIWIVGVSMGTVRAAARDASVSIGFVTSRLLCELSVTVAIVAARGEKGMRVSIVTVGG